LIIIKDLIHIALTLSAKAANKNHHHQSMLERVKKYQKVIEDNDL
jgi:hypothetical protein